MKTLMCAAAGLIIFFTSSAHAQEAAPLHLSVEEKVEQMVVAMQRVVQSHQAMDTRLDAIDAALAELKAKVGTLQKEDSELRVALEKLQVEFNNTRTELLLEIAEVRMVQAKQYAELSQRIADATQDAAAKAALLERVATLTKYQEELKKEFDQFKATKEDAGRFQRVLGHIGAAVDEVGDLVVAGLGSIPFLGKLLH